MVQGREASLHHPGSGQQMEERDGRVPDINSQSVDDKDSQPWGGQSWPGPTSPCGQLRNAAFW